LAENAVEIGQACYFDRLGHIRGLGALHPRPYLSGNIDGDGGASSLCPQTLFVLYDLLFLAPHMVDAMVMGASQYGR
jgi:hypothetical protein